jgi:tetrahydromethanopterin S-methyltransferase subunit G
VINLDNEIRRLRERLDRIETDLIRLALVVARGRGILIAVGVIFGAVAGALLSWALRNY